MIADPDTKRTKIKVKKKDNSFSFGDFGKKAIDLDDFKKIGNIQNSSGVKDAITQQGELGHEIYEQYRKQVLKEKDYNVAHPSSQRFGNIVNGSLRLGQPKETRGNGVNVQNFQYRVNGSIVNIRIIYDRSQSKGNEGGSIFRITQTKNE